VRLHSPPDQFLSLSTFTFNSQDVKELIVFDVPNVQNQLQLKK
jgi:hypothetical protein